MHRHTLVRKGDQGSGAGKLSFGCSAVSSSSVWGLEAPWRPSLQPSSRQAPADGGSGGATLLCRSSGPCEALRGEERTELLTTPDWSRAETRIKSVSCLLLTQLKQRLTVAAREEISRYLPQAADLYVLDNLIEFWERLWVSFAIVWFSGGRQRRRRGELWRVVFLVWELSPRILQQEATVKHFCFCKTTSVTFTCDRPAETSRPWCTWHLRWRRGRRTEADLLSESGPYDNAASPAALHRSALKMGLRGGTSTHTRPRWGT